LREHQIAARFLQNKSQREKIKSSRLKKADTEQDQANNLKDSLPSRTQSISDLYATTTYTFPSLVLQGHKRHCFM
jgi:hypothetical protein